MSPEKHIEEAERLLDLAKNIVEGRTQMEQLILLDTASTHASLAKARIQLNGSRVYNFGPR